MKRLKKLFIIASLFFSVNSYSYYYDYYYPYGGYYYCSDWDRFWGNCVDVVIYNSGAVSQLSKGAALAAVGLLGYAAPEIPEAITSTVTSGVRSVANGLRRITGCGSRRPLRAENPHEE